MPSWNSQYSWRSRWTLRGGLRKARIGGIRYVLVPGWAESGEDLAVDRTGTIERGMLTFTVDAERGGGIAIF